MGLSKVFGNMKIWTQIVILSIINFIFLVVMFFTIENGLNDIGDNIDNIAKKDMPIRKIGASLVKYQFKQNVNFERAMHYADLSYNQGETGKKYVHAKKEFKRTSDMMYEEIFKGKKLLESLVVGVKDSRRLKEFEFVKTALGKIEVKYANYELRVKELFELIENEDNFYASKNIEKIAIDEEELNRELDSFISNIERFTKNSVVSARKQESLLKRNIMIFMIISLVVGSILSYLIIRAIVKPIAAITLVIGKLAQGNTEVVISSSGSKNEIGVMANALEIFRKKLVEIKKIEEEKQIKICEEKKRSDVICNITNQFEGRVEHIISSVEVAAKELAQTSQSMMGAVSGAEQKSSNVVASAEKANNNVQTVAAAAEELSASVGEISRQLIKTTEIVNQSVKEVEGADSTTEELSNAASRIGEVVNLIKDIAEQINLLALNATIESARAGEAGKGFAVVASEVKNLAGQAAKAVEEISQEVENVQNVSNNVVNVLQNIKKGVNEINEYTNNVASAVEEQSSVTQEIASTMQQASTSVFSITTDIEGVTKANQDTSAAASQVLISSENLSTKAEELDNEVKKFVNEIKD